MIGEEDQPLRVFVQASYGEDTGAVVDEIDDIVFLALFGGTDDPDRLVQRYKDQVVFVTRFNQLTVDLDDVPWEYLIAKRNALAIDKNVALFDITIGVAARADAALANIFVKTCGRLGQHVFSIPVVFQVTALLPALPHPSHLQK
ncbi:hypothetical protein D3C72_1769840 [compost metagenome]